MKIPDELHQESTKSRVDEASVSQPLCTVFQLALVNLLQTWAVQPSIVIGHSSGEIAAAYAAGMLSLRSAVKVSYYRGKLSQQMTVPGEAPKGAMLAAGLSAEDAQVFLQDVTSGKITIACINSPQSLTLS